MLLLAPDSAKNEGLLLKMGNLLMQQMQDINTIDFKASEPVKNLKMGLTFLQA